MLKAVKHLEHCLGLLDDGVSMELTEEIACLLKDPDYCANRRVFPVDVSEF